MLRFLADENFDNDILRALRSQDASLDVLRVQDIGLGGFDDEALLAWTARNGRILLTHDVTTITAYAYERVVKELPMPGVIAVPEGGSIREAAGEPCVARELQRR